MEKLDADYLVIGSGAVSMAFVDTLLDEKPDATFIIVDRLHMPGGHWNHAYPFVRLHQPSSLYGVNSTPLGSDRVDEAGSNKGYYELASGAEVLAYFDKVMRERFLPTGRVKYMPMHDYLGNGEIKSMLTEARYTVEVGKSVVDGTFFNTTIPLTHKRKFDVEEGASCIAPNQLPDQAAAFQHFTILGGGKTAMDVGVWLLDHGVAPEAISWLCPRASWLLNRKGTQPGPEFFGGTVGAVASQFEAMAAATSTEDLFLRMEASGVVVRIDKTVTPGMFHYATISDGEAEQLARIDHVIRGAHVTALKSDGMHLSTGDLVTVDETTLYIDCTATAVDFTGRSDIRPVFEDGLITLQAVFAPLVTFGAAIIARVEGQFDDMDKKNALCSPIRFCDTPEEWMPAAIQNMISQNMWGQTPELNQWLNTCRLNPAAAGGRMKALADPDNVAILGRLQKAAIPAVMNVQKLIATLDAATSSE